MKNIKFLALTAVLLLFSVSAFAEEAVQQENQTQAQAEETVNLSKEDMLHNLNNVLNYNPDLVPVIQGLNAKKDEAGALSYEYNGVKLENLDKETLLGLLRSVNQQVSWRNYEKLQRQLKQLKQIDDMNRTQKMLRQQKQTQIPATPKRY